MERKTVPGHCLAQEHWLGLLERMGGEGGGGKYTFLEKWESTSSYTSLKKTHTRYYYGKVYRANKCVSVFTHSQDHENVLSSEDGIL